ncbi:MAG: Fur family transcriptional regulator [Gammaproteobacteria bacterium]
MNERAILQNAGLHPTAGRRAVFSALRAGECLSAADIARHLAGRVPPATVYRALSSLCAAGLARRIPADHGALYTPTREEPSPQLVCARCGKVEEVDSPAVRRYQHTLQKDRGVGALYMVADCRRKECES